MSFIIRSQIRTLLSRLLADMAEARSILTRKGDPMFLEDLGTVSEQIARGIGKINAQIDKWGDIMAVADAHSRGAEEQMFDNFTTDGQSLPEVVDDAARLQTLVDVRIDQLKAAVFSPSATLPSPPQSGASLPPAAAADIVPNVRLPPLTLPEFDGTESAWPAFWASFEHSVHLNAGLTGAQKFTYLAGQLKGAAKAMVEGYSLTDANYKSVVDVLVKRFGDDERRTAILQSELFHLPRPINTTVSLRSFHDHIERICRQLEGMKVDINTNSFLTIAIKEKLPYEVMASLYDKEMDAGRKWSPKDWREALGRIVKLKEAVDDPIDSHASAESKVVSFVPNPPIPPNLGPFSNVQSFHAFPVIQCPRKVTHADCFLCGRGGHRPSSCPSFTTMYARRERLRVLKRCFVCTREGHISSTCRSQLACLCCNGRHHYILCTKRKPFLSPRDNYSAFEVNCDAKESFASSISSASVCDTARGRSANKHYPGVISPPPPMQMSGAIINRPVNDYLSLAARVSSFRATVGGRNDHRNLIGQWPQQMAMSQLIH